MLSFINVNSHILKTIAIYNQKNACHFIWLHFNFSKSYALGVNAPFISKLRTQRKCILKRGINGMCPSDLAFSGYLLIAEHNM